MDSSFLLMTCATAIGFFTLLVALSLTLYKNFRFRENNRTEISTSLTLLRPPSSLPRNWIHNVFPSFHGADVRKSFLSHILKEFKSKGIDPFVDDNITRGEFIGPELIEAIRGSTIAIVLLSKRYASSSWCLDELVEIMKGKEDLGQTVMVIFYEVDPTDVKKQTGDFGNAFRKTCKGKTTEVIGRWRQALVEVATIAGYHSSNWDNEAAMIEKIATDISNTLNNSTPSRDFDGLVGMGAHMEKMKLSLCLESDEVRMIGIWGPTGIGKSTIARFLFSKHSHQFQFSVFMENIRIRYPRPCYNEYVAQLHLQTEFLSKTFKHNLIEVPHLGVLQERLHDKKVLVILDDVDRLGQVDALAGKTDWFGPGSRVVITTEDRKLLKAHKVNHIYNVDFPYSDEALQIFCMNAFGQNSPKDGFEELASEIAYYAGKLPLALKVMGSYFRGMSKQEWENALPRLRSSLDGDIESILKFSYDALCDDCKNLFLHIACFFTSGSIERVVELLANTFLNVRQGLDVLDEKSLITINSGNVEIHILLSRLGREIVRKKYGSELGKYSIREPGKRQFLVDTRDICEVFNDDTAGSSSVIGINLPLFDIKEDIICTSERAFERMSNLQFLRVYGDNDRLYFSQNLNSISRKLRLLDWKSFPMTRLPLNFNPEFLVRLYMQESKLEKLWDGIQPLKYLKSMELSHSKNLKELPDLSTATNLELLLLNGCLSLVKLPSSLGNATNLKRLDLSRCSSLVELPSSVGKATNLYSLHLTECSSLVELPFSIGNATSLKDLNLTACSSLVELPSSIGNLHKLQRLNMTGCSKLKVLPININMQSLYELDLSDCSQLKSFPEISTSVTLLNLLGTAIEEVPPSIRSWPHLLRLGMSYCENLRKFPYTLESITELHLSDIEITLLGPWVKDLSGLRRLVLNGMRKLVVLPQLPDSLLFLDAENCESLTSLDWSFRNINICLNFINCFKLNDEARSLIILTLNRAAVLPGWIEPYFRQPTRGNLTVKLDERPLHSSLRLKVCILLVNKVEHGPRFSCMHLFYRIMEKQNDLTVPYKLDNQCLPRAVTGHLYTVELEVEVTSKELFFEIKLSGDKWPIKEWGVIQLS